MTREQVLKRLSRGPASAAELADQFEVRSADVASAIARIRRNHPGLIETTAPTRRGTKNTVYRLVKQGDRL